MFIPFRSMESSFCIMLYVTVVCSTTNTIGSLFRYGPKLVLQFYLCLIYCIKTPRVQETGKICRVQCLGSSMVAIFQ